MKTSSWWVWLQQTPSAQTKVSHPLNILLKSLVSQRLTISKCRTLQFHEAVFHINFWRKVKNCINFSILSVNCTIQDPNLYCSTPYFVMYNCGNRQKIRTVNKSLICSYTVWIHTWPFVEIFWAVLDGYCQKSYKGKECQKWRGWLHCFLTAQCAGDCLKWNPYMCTCVFIHWERRRKLLWFYWLVVAFRRWSWMWILYSCKYRNVPNKLPLFSSEFQKHRGNCCSHPCLYLLHPSSQLC